ncbi:unnamed protein product [Orchesella dallaii]|uniref:RING-type domain-containing protein n=1 Tax=Orchesella dallaii TaxID=48710 RepID=A0ABP1RZX1_9HEXA
MDASLKRTMKHQSLGSQCSFQCIICLERLDQPSSSELPTVGDEQNQANEQIQPSNENNFAQPGPSRANGSNLGVGARDPNSVSLCTIDKKIIVATACGHMFHLLCIELWFSKKSNRNCCPLCDHVKDQKIMRLYPNASAGSEQRPMTNVTETPPGAGLSPSLDGNTAPVIIPEPTSSIGNIAPKRILARANRRVKDTSITGYVSGTDVINNAVSAGALVGNVTPFPLTFASSNIYNNGSAPTGFPTATLIRNNAPATAGADCRMNTNVAYPSCIPEFNLAPAAAFNFPMMDAINMVSQYHTSTCENIALMKAKGKARLDVEINRINANTASLVSVLAEGYVAAINKDSMDTWLAKMDDCTARNIAKNRCITDLYTNFSRTTSVTSVTGVSNYLATNDSRVGLPVSNLAPGATFNFPMIEAINLVSQYYTSTCENIARMEAVDTADLKAEINRINSNTASLVSVLA